MADEKAPPALLERLLDRFDTRAFIAIELATSMVVLTFVLALKIPESDAFKVLLGAMLTVGFGSAIGWYFNSSAGSEKKDVAQNKMVEKLTAPLTGTGGGSPAAVTAAAEAAAVPAAIAAAPAAAVAAAPAAAKAAAPAAAIEAAPPAAKEAAPPAVEAELDERGYPKQPKE